MIHFLNRYLFCCFIKTKTKITQEIIITDEKEKNKLENITIDDTRISELERQNKSKLHIIVEDLDDYVNNNNSENNSENNDNTFMSVITNDSE